jgi:hypothetical protein
MGVKTAGVGHFAIPTAPAAGTSCTSGAANVFTTTYVQLIASTAAALYITGIYVESSAALGGTYDVVQLATGAAASETIVGQHLIALSTGSTTATGYKPIYPFIPVAVSTRIACKTADSVGGKATLITLECIAQSNVADDGIAITTVSTVTNQLTAAAIAAGVWKDTTAGDFTTAASIGLSVMNGVALGTGLKVNDITTKTGFSITGTTTTFDALQTAQNTAHGAGSWATATGFATPTNITAATGVALAASQHVIVDSGTVTTLSNLPTIPTNWLAGTGVDATAVTKIQAGLATPTNITAAAGCALASSQHVIVDSGTVTTLSNLPAISAGWLTATGIAASALNGKGDWLLSSGYTVPPTVALIRAEIDTNSTKLDVNVGSRLSTGNFIALK